MFYIDSKQLSYLVLVLTRVDGENYTYNISKNEFSVA